MAWLAVESNMKKKKRLCDGLKWFVFAFGMLITARHSILSSTLSISLLSTSLCRIEATKRLKRRNNTRNLCVCVSVCRFLFGFILWHFLAYIHWKPVEVYVCACVCHIYIFGPVCSFHFSYSNRGLSLFLYLFVFFLSFFVWFYFIDSITPVQRSTNYIKWNTFTRAQIRSAKWGDCLNYKGAITANGHQTKDCPLNHI